jgi:curved DNA-binding protein CbpA
VTEVSGDPFLVLGLPPEADLSDDDVRAAWRRIAAATHPDRDDGGDPARFGAAAAAYAALRTSFGRGEALADLGFRGGAGSRAAASRPRAGRLVLRAGAAVAVCAGAFAVAGWTPASLGVLTGALTWLAVTGRHDLTMCSSKVSSERRKTRTKARGG